MIKSHHKPLALAIGLISAGLYQGAQAGESIHFGEATLDWKATGSYTLAARTENRDSKLVADAGGNDGNNNFDRGDLTSNRLSLLLETRLHQGRSGIVASASTFYDDVYHNSTSNKTGMVNYPGSAKKFSSAAKRYHGGYSRLLDLYGYTSVQFSDDVDAQFRLGKHVVSWGEGLFFPGISGVQGPADGTKAAVPGVEVKDVLLPEDQLSTQIQIGNNWALLGHVQYKWHRTLEPEPGSFLSTTDMIGNGGKCLGPYIDGACSFGPRNKKNTPSDYGQWGVGVKYRPSAVTELGLYYLKYHDRLPMPEVNVLANGGLGSYDINYFDKIDLIGASFATMFGPASVGGEISYKDGTPALVSAQVMGADGQYSTIASATRAKVLQTNLNTIYNFGRTPLAQDTMFTAEVSYVNVLSAEKRRIAGAEGLPESIAPRTNKLNDANHGLAISTVLSLSYPGIANGWDLSVPIAYAQQISGSTITGGVGGEGDIRGSVTAELTHRSGLKLALAYVGYFGSAEVDNPRKTRKMTDKDHISFVAKKSF